MRAPLAVVTLLLALARTAGAQQPTPASPHGSLAIPCADCHEATAWRPAKISERFNHGQFAFALEGAHQSAKCMACHQSLEFKGTPSTCASCHKDVHLGELGAACSRCHGTRSFTEHADMYRAHQQTRFPLEGPHAAVDCQSCHPPAPAGGLTWLNRPTTCEACHSADIKALKNPDHVAAGFVRECTSCHARTRWTGGRYDHSVTGYVLSGAHALGTCADCHGNGVYRGHDRACLACHQPDYAAAATPPHAASGFPTDCTVCHSGTSAWQGAKFDHSTTRFALTGAHQAATCMDCHDGNFHGHSTECVSCHQQAFDATVSPPHAAAGFGATCTQCHNTTQWKGAPYDHSATGFPLTGAHRASACSDCHADKVFKGKPTACVSCHQSDYDKATVPNHKQAGFPATCDECHGTGGWAGAQFDHATTGFALTGAHVGQACLACHGDGVWKGRNPACVSCHQAAYNTTTKPPHASLSFPTDCTGCHTTSGWPGGKFDHSTTRFPLTGAHLATSCDQCHGDGVYRGKPTACVACHQSDFDKTTNPNHKTGGFPTDCTQCHTTAGWPGANFNHDATQFPLTGAHKATSCNACHGDGVYAGKPTTCISCHKSAYDGTAKPPHASLSFPTDCTGCHTTSGWPGAKFDHSTTRFPLTGAHLATSCDQCHGDGVYRGKPTACVACHQSDFDKTTNPNHKTGGFPTDCTQCHSTAGWPGANFNHDATKFPLTGAHKATSCNACHGDGVYAGKPTTCISCHKSAYDGTAQPPHASLNFPTDCTQCHTTSGWPGGKFDHSTTPFPLTGAHVPLACAQCHGDGVYKGKPTTCIACHQAAFDGTTNPNHKTAQFPTDCTKCHTTATWAGANFDHNATQFPLTGAHKAVGCTECHADGVYAGKPTACVSCHQGDYDKTTQPPHKSLNFPTNCSTCHTTSGWPGGHFDHSTTQFPLTGAHIPLACAQCHGDGIYAGKPTTCVSCHQADFNGTTNPNHQAAHFPTDCVSCHTTATWTGATFDHDTKSFPIYSGHHAGRWSTCATCHTNSSNYTVFTCLSCHEHNQTSMDAKHQGRNGYRYDSQACYGCHPRGSS